ncbi:hypothetical protein [Pontiella agarivorans]|uniref:Uncharacterized protein n=1 Tax=Pontiella agarivorans TaxID=3038953 RepID=A0ABU5MTD7_9BACT|nr:hypothetical protein [Pontiella agarivorans]MDZ8117450.1 hypothetical protein [Pontiella agarivorans]
MFKGIKTRLVKNGGGSGRAGGSVEFSGRGVQYVFLAGRACRDVLRAGSTQIFWVLPKAISRDWMDDFLKGGRYGERLSGEKCAERTPVHAERLAD